MPVEIDHIIHHDGGLFPESLLVLAQPNCCRRDSSVEPSILGDVITIPTLRRTILEVSNNDSSIIQLSGVLDKGRDSKRNIIMT